MFSILNTLSGKDEKHKGSPRFHLTSPAGTMASALKTHNGGYRLELNWNAADRKQPAHRSAGSSGAVFDCGSVRILPAGIFTISGIPLCSQRAAPTRLHHSFANKYVQ